VNREFRQFLVRRDVVSAWGRIVEWRN